MLNLVFKEKKGFAQLNEKAMQALILNLNQREKLLKELAKVNNFYFTI